MLAAGWLATLGGTGIYIDRRHPDDALFWISLGLVGISAIVAFSALPFRDES